MGCGHHVQVPTQLASMYHFVTILTHDVTPPSPNAVYMRPYQYHLYVCETLYHDVENIPLLIYLLHGFSANFLGRQCLVESACG